MATPSPRPSQTAFLAIMIISVACLLPNAYAWIQEYKSGIVWPEPPVVAPAPTDAPTAPPEDAIVLFDGTNLDAWTDGDAWKIEDGYATVQKKGIRTTESFGDCQLHIEFATPEQVKGNGQGRGNSGVYLMGKYEIQVLDSFDNKTYFDGQCGSIYKQQPPTVNACRGPGEWQIYDIIFEAPQFAEDGSLSKPAYVTVLHNGVLIHHHYELQGGTSYVAPPKYSKHPAKLPISLQHHGNPIRYRNIWIRENIQPLVGKPPQNQKNKQKAEEKEENDKKKADEKG